MCVAARQGSYGSRDPSKKGGSVEGEEKPEKEKVGSWGRRVVFLSSDVHAIGWEVPNPLGGEVVAGMLEEDVRADTDAVFVRWLTLVSTGPTRLNRLELTFT